MMKHILLALGLVWLGSCAPKPMPPLRESLAQRADPVELADLERTALDLSGTSADRERLALLEGLQGEPLSHAGGWLLSLQRDGEQQQVWLAPGGRAELLAHGRSARLVDLQGDRVLLLEDRTVGFSRLLAREPEGKEWVLAEGASGCLRLDEAGRRLLRLQEDPEKIFVYTPGSWRLELEQEIQRSGKGWKLAKPRPHPNAFRALHRFLSAARAGRWRQARAETRLERLLALPEGGHSRKLEASLKLGTPRLLERERLLKAPPRGKIQGLEEASGPGAWRVELQEFGEEGWKLCRLERIL